LAGKKDETTTYEAALECAARAMAVDPGSDDTYVALGCTVGIALNGSGGYERCSPCNRCSRPLGRKLILVEDPVTLERYRDRRVKRNASQVRHRRKKKAR
jgi:hypothetical protein